MCGVHYTQESVLHRHHKARGPPKRHKSCLLASHDERAMTIEPAAYPVPLSSLSTRRVCSTTRRVYSTVTTKRKDPKPSQVPVCLLPMIRMRREGTSSVSSPFVVAVNPEDMPFVVAVNPEDVPFVMAVNAEDVPFVVAVNPEDVPFVVAVNPKDVQYNRESVFHRQDRKSVV